jgi:hypothetical protein
LSALSALGRDSFDATLVAVARLDRHEKLLLIFSIFARFLALRGVILIFSLDLLVEESCAFVGKIVNTVSFGLGIVGLLIRNQLSSRHTIDPERRIPIERKEPQSQQVQQLFAVA